MSVIADKILIVFLDGKHDATPLTSESPAESKAFNEVAKRGCNGVLVLPESSQAASGQQRSDLEHLLSVDRDAGEARFKFPKMPVAFFSASSSSCALATELGFGNVHSLNARETEGEGAVAPASRVKTLLTESESAKQLVLLHLDASSVLGDSDHWVHGVVQDLLQQQEQSAESRCLVALVQTANQLHHPQVNDAASSPFRPRQSYEKIDAAYPTFAASSSSRSANAELRRLLFSFYQKDRTRRDAVQRFDEAEIDALGSYGVMSALMFMKEMAFRLGFAPKYGA